MMALIYLLGAILVAAGQYVLLYYIRLGYISLLIYPLGLFTCVWLTYKAKAMPLVPTLIVGVIGYLLVTYFSAFLFFKESTESFPMTWKANPVNAREGEIEIEFRFQDYPNHFTMLYSNEVYQYLKEQVGDTIPVTLKVGYEMGCVLGYGMKQVGSLEVPPASEGSGGFENQAEPSPWKQYFWCR